MSADLPPLTGRALLSDLLNRQLGDPTFDPEIVALVRKHLDREPVRSRAGQELGQQLLGLAERRSSAKHLP
jgi:hypothetical protein